MKALTRERLGRLLSQTHSAVGKGDGEHAGFSSLNMANLLEMPGKGLIHPPGPSKRSRMHNEWL